MFGHSQRLVKILGLILVTMVFYTLARVEFLLWNWNLFHSKSVSDLLWSFFVGMRFDLSAAFCGAAPALLLALIPWPKSWNPLWEKVTWGLYCLINVPFLILNLVDTEFINFVGRRFTYDTIFILNEAQGKMLNFIGSYWLLFLINTLIVTTFMILAWKILRRPGNIHWVSSGKAWVAHSLVCFLVLAFAVLGIRGGFQRKPINFVNANVFTAPLLNNLVLNSTFTFIKSYGRNEIKHEKYFANKEDMLRLLNGSLRESVLKDRPAKPQNIVIVMLESFGSEYLGPVDGVSRTPFLDSLMKKSLTFEHAYANGRRSIEGVAAIMAGIPALMSEPFISSHFTANYFLGLGTLLAEKKYSTSFFHGGHNGTMYFDSFMQSAGVEKYFGATQYANSADDDGVWGIWDEPFLQWMLTQVNKLPQPFMTSVFTLSSHQPFKVPAKYQDQFKEGSIPILKTISYTDMALEKFFAEAAKQPWYNDTLFIVTADHTSLHYRPEFTNEVGDYKVPLFFFHPTFKFPKVDEQMVVQQIDILPTILDFLNIRQKEENYLGSSIFMKGDKVAVTFNDGIYQLMAKDYRIRWALGQSEPQMFAIDDRDGKKPLSEPAARKEELILKLKANIQYFNEGMWDNKLYYPSL
ncbi:LTA synthase family protein [Bdellovibrio sp. SKB1291214]|uniref:LTA synthase family protein n=1 Tax=Bdellovibrio sp. SKB1291214 TaxID=1732569 RepID=UPI000B51DA67|nr:LTA synthase family protein [Bdellovibrio sp. SKB1291214]UYL07300.1 LTA synthase family protein [Bdellovibrio sp. SKB1291214]